LWVILFVPSGTFGIQLKLDSFTASAPNQYIYEISNHFEGLYPLFTAGSLAFHLVYGALLGFLAGRMTEVRVLIKNRLPCLLDHYVNDATMKSLLIRVACTLN
jgi:hypothetical protein